MKTEEKNQPDIVQEALQQIQTLGRSVIEKSKRRTQVFPDLTKPDILYAHYNLVECIANNLFLKSQNRTFVIDDNNRSVIYFLLYYFNNCPLAEKVFHGRNYKLHNNLLLMGEVGTGKTLLMQIFAEYLRLTKNPNAFQNVSVTQMTNHYSMHNNIDRYTYNEGDSEGFEGRPMNVCLNDIGVNNRPFYGIDTKTIVEDFLHARNEIWTLMTSGRRKYAHLTTNLTLKQLQETFNDNFGRLTDRFKTYNIIQLKGTSRR